MTFVKIFFLFYESVSFFVCRYSVTGKLSVSVLLQPFNVDIDASNCEVEMSDIKLLQSLLNLEHDFDCLKEIVSELLSRFSINLHEFLNQLQFIMPTTSSIKKDKLWGFTDCRCSLKTSPHFVVEKKPLHDNLYTINFQSHPTEISCCDDQDRRTMTHVLISVIKIFEGR